MGWATIGRAWRRLAWPQLQDANSKHHRNAARRSRVSVGSLYVGACFCSISTIAACIVMIMVSLGMLEGSYVTEGLCNATNEWQCELYQSDVEHYIPTFSVGRGSWQSGSRRLASALARMTSGK